MEQSTENNVVKNELIVYSTESAEKYKAIKADPILLHFSVDGSNCPDRKSFFENVGREMNFPTPVGSKFSAFSDWMTNLSWLPDERGICLEITEFEMVLKEEPRWKQTLMDVFREDILPFWEDEVTRVMVGGKRRQFYILLQKRSGELDKQSMSNKAEDKIS